MIFYYKQVDISVVVLENLKGKKIMFLSPVRVIWDTKAQKGAPQEGEVGE